MCIQQLMSQLDELSEEERSIILGNLASKKNAQSNEDGSAETNFSSAPEYIYVSTKIGTIAPPPGLPPPPPPPGFEPLCTSATIENLEPVKVETNSKHFGADPTAAFVYPAAFAKLAFVETTVNTENTLANYQPTSINEKMGFAPFLEDLEAWHHCLDVQPDAWVAAGMPAFPGAMLRLPEIELPVERTSLRASAAVFCPGGLQTKGHSPMSQSAAAKHATIASSEGGEQTKRSHLRYLEAIDASRILMVRKINRLGFESPHTLTGHYSWYGTVERVLVAHSHVQTVHRGVVSSRVRPSGLGFIVMSKAEEADAILKDGRAQQVSGSDITVESFQHRGEDMEGVAPFAL